jgi:hypothetical protein
LATGLQLLHPPSNSTFCQAFGDADRILSDKVNGTTDLISPAIG